MKPAISTRRKAETSIFGARGVSRGTWKKLVHPPSAASTTRLAIVAALRAVIDFFEEIVVLTNQDVLGIERNRLLVRLARVVEPSLVFVADAEIVPRRCVGGVDFRRLLPPEQGFLPQTTLRDLDAKAHLRLRVGARVRKRGLRDTCPQPGAR